MMWWWCLPMSITHKVVSRSGQVEVLARCSIRCDLSMTMTTGAAAVRSLKCGYVDDCASEYWSVIFARWCVSGVVCACEYFAEVTTKRWRVRSCVGYHSCSMDAQPSGSVEYDGISRHLSDQRVLACLIVNFVWFLSSSHKFCCGVRVEVFNGSDDIILSPKDRPWFKMDFRL